MCRVVEGLVARWLKGVGGYAAACTIGFIVACLLSVPLSNPAGANASPRLYGKTHPQILAMGEVRWLEYQTKQSGGSTADISEAYYAYRAALRWRNDQLAAKAPKARRREVATLRQLLIRFANDMEMVRIFNTGGGSLWSNIHAQFLSASEGTIYRLLGGRGATPKPHRTGEVLRALTAAEKALEKNRHEFTNTDDSYKYARESVAKARSTFKAIAKLAARWPRSASDETLEYCIWIAQPGWP